MTTTTPPAARIPVAPVFSNAERLARAGFLAGYSGLTREARELDAHSVRKLRTRSKTVRRDAPSQNRWLQAPVSARRLPGIVRAKSSAWVKATPPSCRDAVTSVGRGTDRSTACR